METEIQRGAIRDERRAYVKALLTRYPDLPSDQHDDLLRWFRGEASALDVGLISIDDEVSQQYALLKRDELDRFAMPTSFSCCCSGRRCAPSSAVLGIWVVDMWKGPKRESLRCGLIPRRQILPADKPLQPLAKHSCLCPV